MKQSYTIPSLPILAPRPSLTEGVIQPEISLDGTWQIQYGEAVHDIVDTAPTAWQDIQVPSAMKLYCDFTQGQKHIYICKKEVIANNDWLNKNVFLRFESVNGFCKIYIDNTLIGEHKNPFLAFGFDITALIKEKNSFTITVVIEEGVDTVSAFSSGGILRSVALYVLPSLHFTALRVNTKFDQQFRNAAVDITFALSNKDPLASVQATLVDPHGLVATQGVLSLPQGDDNEAIGTLIVTTPICWDAEHPNLYTLQLELQSKGKTIQLIEQKVGLRQIDRAGNRLYVNGSEVKLRGACRHEVAAKTGRCLTRAEIEEDVALFKEANCNYIRTSHYPPSEYFLDLCDKFGIYVEDELPLAFIARTLDYTQRNPAETSRYLSTFADIFVRDCNHPSVLMWSLCNESFGGYNFDLMNQWAQKLDPTRPTKFSYPMTISQEHSPVDIWSIHYSEYSMDQAEKRDNVSVLGAQGKDMPVIHDEFVHVPCYNRTEHRRDPNVRNFWGEGLKLFWDKIWNTEGALGGAIWAGIDETNIYTGGETRLEWGIIDIWRRKKPEHFTTRKAYSPIVATQGATVLGGSININVENRFCHTNLQEVTASYTYGDISGKLRCPFALPRGTTTLFIPVRAIENKQLWLTFTDATGVQVDEYLFTPIKQLQVVTQSPENSIPVIVQDKEFLNINGQEFSIKFCKKTGLIVEGKACGECVLTGGPYLHMPYFRLGKWQLGELKTSTLQQNIRVDISGSYANTAQVAFTLIIHSDGTIETFYTVEKLLRMLPHAEKLRVGVDCGGLDELGVYFVTPSGTDSLSWNRNGMHSWYPPDHIARNKGTAMRYVDNLAFGEKPANIWGNDMCNYILNGRYDVEYKGTNDFRSLKPNILTASAYAHNSQAELCALSNAEHSVRMEIEEPETLIVYAKDTALKTTGSWHLIDDLRGSRGGSELWSNEADATVQVQFTGTGIVWYGPVDTIYGIAKVYVDGVLVDDKLSQRVAGVDFPGSAAGYDKKYNYPVYSVNNLAHGRHTLCIKVSGEKNADAGDSYIVLDYFRILRERGEENVRFIICNDYNYPHIAWGNYCKPAILIDDGYANKVTIKLQKR